MKALFFQILILLLLSGCTNLHPLPISEPKAKITVIDANNDPVVTRNRPDYERGGLLPPTNLCQAIENTKIYGDHYSKQSDELRNNSNLANEGVFFGSLVGVVSGLAKAFEPAIGGAALASSSSVVSERYQFNTQSLNYEKASDAMYCMFKSLYEVFPSDQADTYCLDTHDIQNSSDDYIAYSNLIGHIVIRDRIDEIRLKLRKAQSTVTIVTPDRAKLANAFSDYKKYVNAENDAAAAFALLNSQDALFVTGQDKLRQEKAARIIKDLEACVAQF